MQQIQRVLSKPVRLKGIYAGTGLENACGSMGPFMATKASGVDFLWYIQLKNGQQPVLESQICDA